MIGADFHIHTNYSFDSFLTPRTIVKTALKKELSIVAIADHGTTKGALKTADEAKSTSLVVVPALEVETEAGHIMGLFVETAIRAQRINEVLSEIKEQDGIGVLLHPARVYGNNLRAAANKVDVIEALNGRTRRRENLRAQSLAHEFSKPVIAGSDAHTSFEIGCVRTLFEMTPATLEDVRKEIVFGKRLLTGKESPYIVHAFSFGAQLAKSALRLA